MEPRRGFAMPTSVLLASWSPSHRGLRCDLNPERSDIERLAHTVTLKAQTRLDAIRPRPENIVVTLDAGLLQRPGTGYLDGRAPVGMLR